MKTFLEWIELNEAGFLSRLFGAKKPEAASRPELPPPAWLVAAREKKAAEKASSDAWRASVMSQDSPESQTEAPYLTAARWPQQSGGSGDLYELLGKAKELSSFVERIKSRPNSSLTDVKNRSDMYDIYYKLSKSKVYQELPGLSDSDKDRAISIIEKMFKDELKEIAFPDDAFVCPYRKPDFNPSDYSLSEPGSFEACAKVLVKGFKGSRTIKAIVTYRGMTEDERNRWWTDKQKEQYESR